MSETTTDAYIQRQINGYNGASARWSALELRRYYLANANGEREIVHDLVRALMSKVDEPRYGVRAAFETVGALGTYCASPVYARDMRKLRFRRLRKEPLPRVCRLYACGYADCDMATASWTELTVCPHCLSPNVEPSA